MAAENVCIHVNVMSKGDLMLFSRYSLSSGNRCLQVFDLFTFRDRRTDVSLRQAKGC